MVGVAGDTGVERGRALVAALRGRRVPTFVARAEHDPTTLLVVEHLVLAADLQAEAIARAALLIEAPHPRLARIRAAIERPGGIDVVSDFIDGESLADLESTLHAKRIALPAMCALRLISDVLSGLNALHRLAPFAASGHGDLSPHTAMVGLDGRIRLVEILREPGAPRRDGAARFVAPEVLAGGPCSPAGDIYAVGVMLADVLSNGHPLSEYAAPFLEVAERACATAPHDRFAGAAEMLSALAGHFRDQAPSHADVARLMAASVQMEIQARRQSLEEAPILDELALRVALAPPPSMPVTFFAAAPLPGSRRPSSWPTSMEPGPTSVPPSSSPSSRQTDRPPTGFGSVAASGMALPLGAIPPVGLISSIENAPPPPTGLAAPVPAPLAVRRTVPMSDASVPSRPPAPSAPPPVAPASAMIRAARAAMASNEPGPASGSWRYASTNATAPPRRAITQPVPEESIVIAIDPPPPPATPRLHQQTPQAFVHLASTAPGPMPQPFMPAGHIAHPPPPLNHAAPFPVGPAIADLPPMRKQIATGPDLSLAKRVAEEREQRSPRLLILSVTLILVGIAVSVLLTQQSKPAPASRDNAEMDGRRH